MRSIQTTMLLLILALNGTNNVMSQNSAQMKTVIQSVVFIYDVKSKPCEPPPPNQLLLPAGSGFVVGLAKKSSTKEKWEGWKFVITTEHVIANRDAVILRLNHKDKPEFVCYPVTLERSGNNQNVFSSAKQEIDLVAIYIPHISEADPAVFDYSLTMSKTMVDATEVRVGTDVFMVGYLYGYSGNKQNYPVIRFGKIALMTEETWYPSQRKLNEQAYLVEIQSTPGLSGAPVILQSYQYRINDKREFQSRLMPPYIFGVNKGVLLLPKELGGTQGLAAVEPGYNLQDLMKSIANRLISQGQDVILESPKD